MDRQEYKLGQIVRLKADKKKLRPVWFGIVSYVSSNKDFIRVEFHQGYEETIIELGFYAFEDEYKHLSIASIKEVEWLVSERKRSCLKKISTAKKQFKKEVKTIIINYPHLKNFVKL